MRLLVVEDEELIRNQLQKLLKQAGYVVDAAQDGEEGLYYGLEYSYDAVLIDIGLPKLDGIELITRMRAAGCTYPTLILTARGHWKEKVQGLEAGADDYVVKPFQPEEVLARIQALIRRSCGLARSVIEFGALCLDLSAKEVHLQGQALDVTGFEYKVLEYFMLHPGEVISKSVLTEHLYAQDFERDSNTIEVFVGRLRKKITLDDKKPIETLRGRGYKFHVDCF